MRNIAIIGIVAAGLALLIFNHHSSIAKRSNIDERISCWEHEVEAGLPGTSSKASVLSFFSQRGVTLECCTSAKNLSNAYAGVDGKAMGAFGEHQLQLLILVPINNDVLTGKVEFTTVPVN